MTNLQPKITAILTNPLEAAERASSGIGFVGADIPLDLLVLTEQPIGHLPWDTPATVNFADQWLEPSFPGWARHILQHWYDGRFDALKQVVFSRSDDASQRLYYYISELQQRGRLAGPQPLIFDIALIERAASLERTAFAITTLAEQLSVPLAGLSRGIERINALRACLQTVMAGRRADGPYYEQLGRACLYSGEALWLTQASHAHPPVPSAAVDQDARLGVLLAGSVPPDERLHRAVASAGAVVVGEAHMHYLGRLGAPLALQQSDHAMGLAQHLRTTAVSPRSFRDRGQWLLQRVRETQARAVVLWLTREDESQAWHVPAQRRALQAAGVPTLILTTTQWLAGDDVTQEIARFVQEQGS